MATNYEVSSLYTSSLRKVLENGKGAFEVYRARNGEVLNTLESRDAAERYIEDRDYNPERVKVRKLSDDESEDEQFAREIRDQVVKLKDENYWNNRDKSIYRLAPGTEVITSPDGEKFVLLKTVFD